MTFRWWCWLWKLAGASLLGMGGAIAFGGGLSPIALFGNCALAQIVPDGTLGAESSVVTPLAPGSTVDVIQGGTTRGANLFHSFEQFSIPTGSAAYFNNALDIQNIISRVTGSSISNIDGLIRANGTANLFLLNPNGIIFGPNASLNIGGSFLGSTASSLNFADGNQFSATAPQTTPLLTVSVPLGLQFGGTAGGIQVQGSGLQVQNGQTLALMGGDVSVQGGEEGFLQALGGRIELGGLAGAAMVEIEGQQTEGGFRLTRLTFPNSVERADVLLTNLAFVDVAASGGGSIAINARNIDISGGSLVRGGLKTNLGFPGATAGDITLNATGAIVFANGGGIANNVRTGAVGKGGNIAITAESLSVRDGAQLSTSTLGHGDAGSVNINARNTVSFDGASSDGFSSGVRTTVGAVSVGKGGGIDITTGSLYMTNGAQLVASTFGQGDAGNVNINTRDTVSFDGVNSDGFSTVEPGGVGKGGNINITTGSLSVTNGAQLSTFTSGQGDAGSVNINARDTVSFDGNVNGFASAAFSTVEPGIVGKGGNINISTGFLSVTNGAQLSAYTSGQGDAGSVNINARDTVSFDRSFALSLVEQGAIGKGGDINITTGSLAVTNEAQLIAGSAGQGDAGSVNINARDTVSFDGFASVAFSNVAKEGVGKAGGINITTGSLSVTNGAQLVAVTKGQGDAGSVNISARDTVSFDGSVQGFASGAFSSVEPDALGKGSDIRITTESLLVTNGAELNASSLGQGPAGNIEVDSGSIQLDNQASIQARTASGNGGNITQRVQDVLLLRRGSQISTTAGTAQAEGDGGNIKINAPFIVAVPSENSDINANAFTGKGGRVDITAQGIFGTQFRPRLTPQSDITASSEFGVQGVVEINTPDVDPSQGLVNLPAELVDASRLIAQGCGAGGRQGESEFIVTGRGGLPIRPLDADLEPYSTGTVRSIPSSRGTEGQRGRRAEGNWNIPSPLPSISRAPLPLLNPSTNPTTTAPTQIVEANGWVINNKGEVVLIASAPTVTPHIPSMRSLTCNTP